jgi:parallel beta helix pectate lyase-like protein
MLKIKRIIFVTGVLALAALGVNAENKSLSVTDFGAVPNDGKDDLAAIQKCVNAAGKTGKTCFIPKGNYNLSKSLWLGTNATLFGEGKKSILTFSKGAIQALKNGNKGFYYTGNYNNEIIGGKRKRGTLEKAVSKGSKTFSIKTKDAFKKGDWIFINNNRKDTWVILEKKSKGQDTHAYLNGSKDVLVKGQVAKITAVKANQITIDRELDSGYAPGAIVGNHVGARNIYIHDLSIIKNSGGKRAYAVTFEQPFNARFENLTIKATKGAGGIRLAHYAFRCLIKNCNITSSGSYAISILNFSSENKVLNNDVTFITGGDCAILIMMYCKQNLIANNKVNCLSKLRSHEGGIYIHTTSFENKVLNNKIKSASAGIGAYYGANNNLFKGNVVTNPNTGITIWYAGAGNVFSNNKFFFGKTIRPGNHTGIYSFCSQNSTIDNNKFSGDLNFGCNVGPKKNCSFKKIKFQKYFISWTGLGFKCDISLNKNSFRSTKSGFKEFNY